MTANGLPPAVLKARGGTMGWGLANVNVLLDPAPCDASRGEYGWDGTAGTIFWVDPAKQTVIVLMTQSSPANPDSVRQRFKAIAQRAIGNSTPWSAFARGGAGRRRRAGRRRAPRSSARWR